MKNKYLKFFIYAATDALKVKICESRLQEREEEHKDD